MKGKEQARFSEIAYGSLMEVLNLLIVAVDLHYINQIELQQIRPIIEDVSKKINALRRSQLEKHQKQKKTSSPYPLNSSTSQLLNLLTPLKTSDPAHTAALPAR